MELWAGNFDHFQKTNLSELDNYLKIRSRVLVYMFHELIRASEKFSFQDQNNKFARKGCLV